MTVKLTVTYHGQVHEFEGKFAFVGVLGQDGLKAMVAGAVLHAQELLELNYLVTATLDATNMAARESFKLPGILLVNTSGDVRPMGPDAPQDG